MSGSRLAISRTKSLYLDDSYMQLILSYLEYMRWLHIECRYLLPTTKLTGFGDQRTFYIDPDRHLTRRQLWNVVTEAGPETWPHLFRETQGAKVARRYENTITGAFAVK